MIFYLKASSKEVNTTLSVQLMCPCTSVSLVFVANPSSSIPHPVCIPQGASLALWLKYTIFTQGVVFLNPRKINGGDRKGIEP